ncbi:hypothetical protein AB1207_22070 [Kineococcus endophyticus]|uniref:Uncharacterized protein n=1 Tax=Kineococcus endophyticus TaxID=1181883 RepID=A0ABV3PCS9_9ACTN
MTQQVSKKDNDLAYLIMACVALLAVQRLWSTRIKPWVLENLQAVQAGDWQHSVSGDVTTLDVVGMSLLLLPVVVLLLLIRQRRKNSKDAKNKTKENS